LVAFLTFAGGQADADTLAYELSSNDQFGTLDLNDGDFSQIGSSETTVLAGLGVDDGDLFGVAYEGNGQLYEIDAATAALTAVGGNSLVEYAAFGSTLTGLYAMSITGSNVFQLYSINPSNGAATAVGSPTTLNPGGDYQLSTNSSTLYFALLDSLYTINTTTGAATLVGSMGSVEMGGLVLTGGTLYGGEAFPASAVATINTSNGAATVGPTITGTSAAVAGLAPDPLPASSTPEPASWLLLGPAIMVLKLLRSRSR
jgi:hypothetical protein